MGGEDGVVEGICAPKRGLDILVIKMGGIEHQDVHMVARHASLENGLECECMRV